MFLRHAGAMAVRHARLGVELRNVTTDKGKTRQGKSLLTLRGQIVVAMVMVLVVVVEVVVV